MAKYRILPKEEPQSESSFQPSVGGFVDNLTKAAKQFGLGAAEGLGGTYGDILELIGLQKSGLSSREREKYEAESRADPYQLAMMAGEETELPSFFRLPSSQNIEELAKDVGLHPGTPETFTQEASRRTGRFAGAGASFGAPGLKQSLAAGATGAGLKEMGAPAWVQAAGELLATIKASPTAKSVTSSSPQVANKLKELEKIGFDQNDLTLAKNALEERGWLKKSAKLTNQAEKQFKQTMEASEGLIKDALERSYPGLESGGVSHLKENASNLFKDVKEAGKSVRIPNHALLTNAIDKAISKVKSKISNLPEEKDALAFLQEGRDALLSKGSKVTAEDYIDWYQKINKIGKWVEPHTKDAILGELKTNLKDALKAQGPVGRKIGEQFEEANRVWMRYLSAEDVVDLVKKASTEEGINFTKLSKSLENPDNMKSLVRGLGEAEAANVRKISEAASKIGDLEKALRNNLSKDVLGPASKIYALGRAAFGDVRAVKALFGAEVASRIGSKFLTEPSWQNLQLKLLDAVKRESPKEVMSMVKALEEKVSDLTKEAPPSSPTKPRYRLVKD